MIFQGSEIGIEESIDRTPIVAEFKNKGMNEVTRRKDG